MHPSLLHPMRLGILPALAALALLAPALLPADARPAFLRTTTFADGMDYEMERRIVPGVTHRFLASSEGPLTINVVEIDTTRPDLEIETEAGRGTLSGLERMPSMVERKSTDDRRHVVGINADFFEWSGPPINLFVDEEMIWRGPLGDREVYAFDEAGNHWIGLPQMRMTVTDSAGETLRINRVNFPVAGEPVTIYTWPIGAGMPAPTPGTESITLKLAEPRWLPNEPMRAVVTDRNEMPALPLGRDVVHLRMTRGEVPAWLKPGHEVTLMAEFPHLPGRVVGVVGGGPQLVRDGRSLRSRRVNDDGTPNQGNVVRHPRTAVGLKDGGRTLVFVTIDGRQPGRSIGIGFGFADMADLMIELGMEQALNLDGGGSTTLMFGDEVANFPSDAGGPRAVSNALMVFRTAEVGGLGAIDVRPSGVPIPAGTALQLRAHGMDDDGEQVPVNPGDLSWKVEEGDARVDGSGLLQVGSTPGEIVVSVTATRPGAEPVRATARLEVAATAGIVAEPRAMIFDVGESVPLRFGTRSVAGDALWTSASMWQVDAPGFVSWDADRGTVTATGRGSGRIRVRLGGEEISVPVAVGEFLETPVHGFDRLPDAGVELGLIRADAARTRVRLDREEKAEGEASWRLEHTMEPGGTSRIDLPIDVELVGEPLAVGIRVRGDGAGHWLRGELRDAHGNGYYLNFTEMSPGIDWTDWRFVQATLATAPAMGAFSEPMTYPVTLRRIYIAQLREENKQPGTVWFDGLVALSIPE